MLKKNGKIKIINIIKINFFILYNFEKKLKNIKNNKKMYKKYIETLDCR
jgi:hypothetical protein